jgi:hypothetical protein
LFELIDRELFIKRGCCCVGLGSADGSSTSEFVVANSKCAAIWCGEKRLAIDFHSLSIDRTNERTNTNEHRQAGMGEREEFLFLAVVQPFLVDVQTVSKVMRARRGSAKFEYTHSYEIVKEAYPELWVIKSWSYLSFN